MNNNKAFALEQTQRQTQTSVARSMTNEELAIQIQLGKGEYYAELWQNCRKLLFKIMQSKLCGVPLPVYISREDLEQEMYFALCKAAQAYDDTKPYSFTSYLNYSVINTLHGILRRSAGREVSYNQTVGEDGETELCEFIEDETAAAKLFCVELTDLQRIVRQTVAGLPRREREVIELYYFDSLSFKELSELTGLDKKDIRRLKEKGLNILRRSKQIRALHYEFQDHYGGNEPCGFV